MSNSAADEREEDTPEPPAIPVSRAGDLWHLGKHRVLCGDATSKIDVERLLRGITQTLMVTDPPYGVNYEPAWRNEACGTKTKRTGTVKNDDRADWTEAWALFPGDVAYVWHAALHAGTVADNLGSAGFDIRSQVMWSKDRMVLSRGHYHWQHEPCWYAVRRGGTGMVRRSDADHAVADPEPRPGCRHFPRHPEVRGMHAPADAEQHLARPGGLRPVPRIGHHRHRRRDCGAKLLRLRTRSGLRGRHRDPLGRPSQAKNPCWRRPARRSTSSAARSMQVS